MTEAETHKIASVEMQMFTDYELFISISLYKNVSKRGHQEILPVYQKIAKIRSTDKYTVNNNL